MANAGEEHVVVVGAGGLGLAFAASLAGSGAMVTLAVRAGSEPQLREAASLEIEGARSLVVDVATAPRRGAVAIAATHDVDAPADAVIFAVKGFALKAAVAQYRSGRGGLRSDAWVAGLQNGVVKDDVLGEAFGPTRVLGMATTLGAQRTAPGRVRVAALGTTYVGELGQPPSARARAAGAAFDAAGIPVLVVDDARRLVWSKFAHAAGIFGVSSLTGLATGELFARRPLVLAYRDLLEEVSAVARAEDVALDDYPGLEIARNLAESRSEMADRIVSAFSAGPPGALSYSSMLQDLRAGRRTEVDAIFGDLSRRAERAGVAAPRAALVAQLVQGMENASPA